MGQKAREIIDIDAEELITTLNKLYSNEWLAYYQYWIGARIITGPARRLAASELEEHAGEELEHATMIADRIIQLGGNPVLSPQEWYENTSCGYKKPEDTHVVSILQQNLDAERCGIDDYKKLLNMVHDKDQVTYNMVLDILETELEHEEEIQAILEDIEVMKKRL